MKEIDLIRMIPIIIENSRIQSKKILKGKRIDFYIENVILKDNEDVNLLYKSDNIHAIKDLLDRGYSSRLDLIYIDPPFYSNSKYTHRIELINKDGKQSIETQGYSDTWEDGIKEYLEMMSVRLFLMKELMSDRASIYVHLDYRTVHYMKIIMDCIFGKDNFLNEIIWAYKSGGTSSKHFSRKHDNILVYTKTKDYIFNPQKEKSYNRDFRPYKFKNVQEYEDELGWYTLVNLKDVWNLNMVGRTSNERMGYRTQKPETLLERIILSSSREDSIIADFFAGSGTTAIVAQRNKRRWIISDSGDISTSIIRKRVGQIANEGYTILNINEFRFENRIRFDYKKEINEKSIIYNFNFMDYDIDLDSLELNNKNKRILENIISTNPLGLVDYIGIGYLTKENEINIIYEELRKQDRLIIDTNIEVKIAEDKDLILRVVDVFGNGFLQKIYS